jgi:hypothetical protein
VGGIFVGVSPEVETEGDSAILFALPDEGGRSQTGQAQAGTPTRERLSSETRPRIASAKVRFTRGR